MSCFFLCNQKLQNCHNRRAGLPKCIIFGVLLLHILYYHVQNFMLWIFQMMQSKARSGHAS